MDFKKINVVTINLNNKIGLENTISSVINQTFFDKINYIIIDGGSTDGSVDVIENNEKKLAFWVSEKDKGLYNAMNKGIDAANGEYILFLNSGDEFYDNQSIEKCYNFLDKDIVYGNLFVDDKEKKYIKNSLVKKYPDVVTHKYMVYDTLPHNGSFIKLELIKKENYIEDFKIISDWAWFYNKIINDRCSYKHIDVVVSKFYLGGVSSDENAIRKEKIRFFKEYDKSPRITIIMPCYNYAHYITETIDSLKSSTYNRWKCIIINDGSTDNSEEVILGQINNDKRFTYVRQPNKGLSYVRNIGIRMANTKYIMCLDPDDKISSTYIENGIKYLDEHDDCTLYYGRAKMFWDDGTEKEWNLDNFDYKLLIRCNHIYSSFIYRKEDFNRVGGYDEYMNGYEDWEFLIRLLYGGKKVHMTDDVVFYYRRHNGSMDNSASKNLERYKRYIYNKNKELILNALKNE